MERIKIIQKIDRDLGEIDEMGNFDRPKVELLGIIFYKINQYLNMGGDLRILNENLDNILESGDGSQINIASYSEAIIEL